MNKVKYIGNELELFALAKNWKKYWSDQIVPFLGSDIIEVGAGLGATTRSLLPKVPKLEKWVCLEPDPKLANQIPENILDAPKNEKVSIVVNTLSGMSSDVCFDTALYIDVIEHIEDDHKELRTAWNVLRPGGHLIIVVPAHQYLFSPFDRAIGHFRRYNMQRLRAALPGEGVTLVERYLDAVGFILSLGNKIILKQSYPTRKQILFWDSLIVPMSQIIDPILLHKVGKSILCVLQKTNLEKD